MNEQHPTSTSWRSGLLPAAILTLCVTHFDSVAYGQVGWTDQQLDQWVFQQYGNASTARARLKESLQLYTENIDQICSLSDAQKQKLQLAGQGDVERFFRKYKDFKTKFQAVRNEQQQANKVFQDIRPLQAKLRTGLFDRDSLLQKCLVNTINRKQFLQYLKVDKDRQRFHHEARIGVIISLLDQAAPVTAEQRRALSQLLQRETKPLEKFSQYDHYAMMYQAAKIDDGKFQQILDDIQWLIFKQQLGQMRGMEQWLKQNGILSDDDDSEILLPDEQVAAE